MSHLSKHEQKALQLFKQRLLAKFPDRVEDIKLFGSKARGEAAKHSDVDILVVLQHMTWQDKRAVRAIAADIIFNTNVVLSVQVLSTKQLEGMRQRRAIFWQMIEPDLLPL